MTLYHTKSWLHSVEQNMRYERVHTYRRIRPLGPSGSKLGKVVSHEESSLSNHHAHSNAHSCILSNSLPPLTPIRHILDRHARSCNDARSYGRNGDKLWSGGAGLEERVRLLKEGVYFNEV